MNRRHYAKVAAYVSTQECVPCGVPQGSAPGPTLLIVYMNNIHRTVAPNADSIYYVADIALLLHGRTWKLVHDKAQHIA